MRPVDVGLQSVGPGAPPYFREAGTIRQRAASPTCAAFHRRLLDHRRENHYSGSGLQRWYGGNDSTYIPAAGSRTGQQCAWRHEVCTHRHPQRRDTARFQGEVLIDRDGPLRGTPHEVVVGVVLIISAGSESGGVRTSALFPCHTVSKIVSLMPKHGKQSATHNETLKRNSTSGS